MNHVKSGVIYFSAFIFSYDTIHVSGTIHTWNRGLTKVNDVDKSHTFNEEDATARFRRFIDPTIGSLGLHSI